MTLWLWASAAIAQPADPTELQQTEAGAVRVIEACRADPGCGHDREVLGQAFLARAVAAAVLRGEVDVAAAANARALVPELAAIWQGLLPSEATASVEDWVLAWVPVVPMIPIRGRVFERGSGRPVPGASLRLDDEPVPLDPEGAFEVTVTPGPHTLQTAVGERHHPARWTIDDDPAPLELAIDRRSWAPTPLPRDRDLAHTFSANELRVMAGTLGDPLRALQSLPSVARPSSVEGDLVMRGTEAYATRVTVDGVPVPYLHHFLVGRSVIDPLLVERVTARPGALPARLGGAIGGVVEVTTADRPPDPGLHGRVRADLMDASLALEGPIDRGWRYAVSARNAWPATLFSVGSRGVGILTGRPHPTFGYTDYFVRLSRGDRVALSVFGAQDGLTLRDRQTEDTYQNVLQSGFHRVLARVSGASGGRSGRAWIATGPDRQLSQLDGFGVLTDSVDRVRMAGWQTVGHASAGIALGELAASAGAEITHRYVRVEDFTWSHLDPDRTDGKRDHYVAPAAFASLARRDDRGRIEAGVRVSAYVFGGGRALVPEPRLELSRRFGPLTLLASGGRTSQVAPPERLCCGRWEPGTALGDAWRAEVGLALEAESGLRATLVGYRLEARGLLDKELHHVTVPDPPLWDPISRQVGPAWSVSHARYTPAPASARGAELLVRLPEGGRWSGHLAASAGRSTRRFDDTLRPADHDLPWSTTLALARRLPRGWLVSTRLTASAGYPYTPEQPVYELGGAWSGSHPGWGGLAGAPSSARFVPYGRLDLRIERSWTALRSRWSVHLDVFNLLNVPNPVVPTWDWSHTEVLWLPSELVYAPILPDVGLEVSF